MFNHSQKIISLVWAVPLLLTVSVTESKAAINKTTIENTSSNAIAALEPKAIGFSGSPSMSLSEQNLIVDCVGSLTSSVTGTETTTKTKKNISSQSSQGLQLLIAARPDQQTKKCRVLRDC